MSIFTPKSPSARRRRFSWRLISLLIGAALFILLIGGFAAYRKVALARRYARLRSSGLAEVAAGQWTDGLRDLGFYLQRYPYDGPAWTAYIEARPKIPEDGHREISDTISGLRMLLRIDPSRESAQRQLLDLYIQTGYFAEAADLAGPLLESYPDDVHLLRQQTIALTALGKFPDALATARHWTDLAPLDMEGQIRLLTLMQQNNLPGLEIIDAAAKRLKQNPNRPRFELALAYAYLLTDDRDSATNLLKIIVSQPPPDDEYFDRLLLRELSALQMTDQSVVLLRRMAAQRPTVAIYRQLIDQLWETDRTADALAIYDLPGASVIASDPEMVALRGVCLIQLQRSSEVSPIIDTLNAMAAKGDSVAAAWGLILQQLQSNTSIDAHKLFDVCQAALNQNPNDDYLRQFLGEAYMTLGEEDLAIDVWLKVAADRPDWAAPVVRLAGVMIDAGRYDSAIAMANEAIRRAPRSIQVALTVAEVDFGCLQAGRFDRPDALLSLVDQISAADPGLQQAMAIRVGTLAWEHKTAQAADALKQILASKYPLSQALLLRLAGLSRVDKMGLEQACFDRCQRDHGMTSALAYAEALDHFITGNSAAGLASFNAVRQSAGAAGNTLDWRTQLARYLDLIGDPHALDALTRLGDQNPDNLPLQEMILNCQSVRNSKGFMRRTIDRIHAITGDDGIAWQLAQARWLLDFSSADDSQSAGSAETILKSLLGTSPDSPDIRLQLARAYQRQGRLLDAIDQATTASELSPSATSISLYLASLYSLHCDFDRAREQIERTISSDLLSDQQRRQAAALLEQQGESRQALDLLQQVSGPAESSEMGDLMLLTLYRQQNDPARVDQLCQRLLKHPDLITIPVVADVEASEGNTAGAMAVLKLLDGNKTSPGARELVLADFALKYESPQIALQLYQRATEVAPNDSATWLALLKFYIATGQGTQMQEAILQGLRQVPDDPDLAAIHAYTPELVSAVGDPQLRPIALSFAIAPRGGAASNAQAARQVIDSVLSARSEGANPEEIAAQLSPIADHYPRFLPLLMYMATLQNGCGNLNAAALTAAQAAEIAPGAIEPYRLLTTILSAAGRWPEVIDAATKWKERAVVKTVEPDIAIANADLSLQDPVSAMKVLDPDLSETASPLNVQVRATYARAEQLAGRGDIADMMEPLLHGDAASQRTWMIFAAQDLPTDQGEIWLDRIQKIIPPGDIDQRTFLSQMWLILSNRANNPAFAANSRSILQQLAARPDASAQVFLALGMQAEHDKNLAAAEADYRRCLKINPDLPVPLNNLAMIIAERGENLAEAQSLVDHALNIWPNAAPLYDTLAFIQSKQRNYDQAVSQMRQALQRDPQNPRYLLSLARYLLADAQPLQAGDALARFDALSTQRAGVSADLKQQEQAIRAAIANHGQLPG